MMEYKNQEADVASPPIRVRPRLIIHGGAGNITPATLSPDKYKEYRAALLETVNKTNPKPYSCLPCYDQTNQLQFV